MAALQYAGATRQEWRHRCSVSFRTSWDAAAAAETTAHVDLAACWAASSAGDPVETGTTIAVIPGMMTVGARLTTMMTTGAGMVSGGGGGVTMTTMTRSSSPPLCKDCQQRPVMPWHGRCQDCLVRLARPKP